MGTEAQEVGHTFRGFELQGNDVRAKLPSGTRYLVDYSSMYQKYCIISIIPVNIREIRKYESTNISWSTE